jgi:branched-chain amino acid transport system ATP-binding protein
MSLLQIKNLEAGYSKNQVLFGINLELQAGEIVALIGPNGAGKSTVLRAIFNLADIYKGSIYFQGKEITNKETHQLIVEGISYMPQGNLVFKSLTVKENLLIGAYCLKNEEILNQNLEVVYKIFPFLKEKTNFLASELSGGEQQMVALARALMTNPKLLLLDEPSLGLSPKMMKEIYQKIEEINQEGVSLLIVEQNVHLVLSVARKIYLLANGSVKHIGPPADFQDMERMRTFYLGA